MFDGRQRWPRIVKLLGGNGPTKPVRRQFSLVSFRVSRENTRRSSSCAEDLECRLEKVTCSQSGFASTIVLAGFRHPSSILEATSPAECSTGRA
jgi:hypothetical protein